MLYLRTIPRRRSYFARGSFSGLIKTLIAGSAVPGPAAESLEKAISEKLGLPNPAVVTSGRLALRLILETSGLEPGSEILVPGYTFGLVYPAIRASGFNPAPVDIDPQTFLMDPAKADAAVTPRTGALLATHLFGEPCDMDGFLDISRKRGLLLLEDCAQSIGASSRGRVTGAIGDAGFTSFDVSKTLHGFRGGALFVRDSAWLNRIREKILELGAAAKSPIGEVARGYLQHALIQSPLWRGAMIMIGLESLQRFMYYLYRKGESSAAAPGVAAKMGPAALHDAPACMVNHNLDSLAQRIERRRAVRALYMDLLGETLEFQRSDPGNRGSAHMAVARAPCDVFRLRRYLALRGIDCGVAGEVADDCMNSPGSVVDKVFNEAVALPIHSRLSDSDVHYIAGVVKAGIKKTSSR